MPEIKFVCNFCERQVSIDLEKLYTGDDEYYMLRYTVEISIYHECYTNGDYELRSNKIYSN